ncbi:hypothetical protein TCDM_00810 [Trypanosoma cruzi Dm28c]|uniref:Uncharacterized protein n=2 Tax=Trypanosoma cruzi TaxID=5693 RepID=V5BR63_TRYCR|nr:hypothetical protein TCDM_00810 [Trypanosoma cruzi Dm28c]
MHFSLLVFHIHFTRSSSLFFRFCMQVATREGWWEEGGEKKEGVFEGAIEEKTVMSFFFDEDSGDEPAKKRHCTEQQQRAQGRPHGGFFNGNGEKDEDEDEKPVLARAGSDRVGLRLLQGMQKPTSSSSSVLLSGKEKMRVVEAYVPLSVGGFMESSAETAVDNLSQIKPGNVMCLRSPASSASQASTGMNFVKETDLTEEERRYGKRLSSNMTQELFEVGRVDRDTGMLEAIFLDGTRRNLKAYAVRPAGFVEKELFRQWKRDPNSRPVRTVYAASQDANASPSLSSTTQTTRTTAVDSANRKNNTAAVELMPWWVSPQLIVRVVEKSAGDLFGKKFVVKSLSRKEGKIRLVPWQRSAGNGESAENSPVDIVGCEALETIVPKVGEQGIIVLGNMRGELVKVMERHRDVNGELASLKVCSTLTGNEFTVGPHEVCQLACPRP